MTLMSRRRVDLHRITMRSALYCILLLACPAVLASPAGAGRGLTEARIVEVNDGDTVVITMEGKSYRTRLIGINAPEMGQEPWGRKAKKRLHELVTAAGGRVLVETDITKFDKYNRLLAYLWLDEKTLINELMLRNGYAVLFTIQPNSNHVDRLKKAQTAAREDHAGIWGPNDLTEKPIEYKKTHPRK